MKWNQNFIGPTKLARRLVGNKYILVTTNYATKWVEAKALKINIAIITSRFFYEYILTRFGCPLAIIINDGVHFINDTIKHLT
jgi:hypothetical protein